MVQLDIQQTSRRMPARLSKGASNHYYVEEPKIFQFSPRFLLGLPRM